MDWGAVIKTVLETRETTELWNRNLDRDEILEAYHELQKLIDSSLFRNKVSSTLEESKKEKGFKVMISYSPLEDVPESSPPEKRRL